MTLVLVVGVVAGQERPEAETMPPVPEDAPRGPVQQAGGQRVPVEFQPPSLDFGVLPPGGKGRGRARIWNAGETPLRIVKSITSCGCTAADDLSGRVIEPGGFTEFGTVMEMKSGLGEKKEKITVFFEGFEQTQVIFYFEASVARAVHATPPHITATGAMGGQFVLESLDGEPFRVLASQNRPPDFVDFDPATDSPRSRYAIRWDLTAENAAGRVPWFWVVETDHPGAALVDLRIRHDLTRPERPPGRPWVPKDQRLLIDRVSAGETVEVVAKIEYPESIAPEVTGASISGDPRQFEATLAGVDPDGQFLKYKIRITPRPAPPGLIYDALTLHASGFSAPLLIIGTLEERSGDSTLVLAGAGGAAVIVLAAAIFFVRRRGPS